MSEVISIPGHNSEKVGPRIRTGRGVLDVSILQIKPLEIKATHQDKRCFFDILRRQESASVPDKYGALGRYQFSVPLSLMASVERERGVFRSVVLLIAKRGARDHRFRGLLALRGGHGVALTGDFPF
ncbi:hypothetical protein NDU88_005666 [Pleurodeles waltl]|uniref:Uncharacterized protein n=1 Tax=Pleurodeles waltl TaxID=8319 RepID=A0AAV7VKM2_PLEWA|nr:hypothetical protein NDU88_005666 [Pleurodeles waltl]